MFLKMCHVRECELFEGRNKKYNSNILCSFILLGKVSILSKGSRRMFFFLNRARGLEETKARAISILRNLPKAEVCDCTDGFSVFEHVVYAHSQASPVQPLSFVSPSPACQCL